MPNTRTDNLASPLGRAVVSENDLNVRSGAGRHFRVIDRLKKGASVEIFQKKGDWFQIGQGRWVAGEFVVAEFFEEKEAAVESDFSIEKSGSLPLGTIVGTKRLDVRQGPATSFPIVRILTATDCFDVLEKDGNWLRIGENEWVLAAFVQTDIS